MFSRDTMAKFDYLVTDSMTWTDNGGRRMRLWIPAEVGEVADRQSFMETLVDRTVGILNDEPIDIRQSYVPSRRPRLRIRVAVDRIAPPSRLR
jgi:hypothetical protein